MTEYIVKYEDTLEVVGELIRCPDCGYCVTYYHGKEAPNMFTYLCNYQAMHVEENDYCSYAKRAENDTRGKG